MERGNKTGQRRLLWFDPLDHQTSRQNSQRPARVGCINTPLALLSLSCHPPFRPEIAAAVEKWNMWRLGPRNVVGPQHATPFLLLVQRPVNFTSIALPQPATQPWRPVGLRRAMPWVASPFFATPLAQPSLRARQGP